MSFGGTADVAGFGWATEVQAPRPPCSTPLRTNYLEPCGSRRIGGRTLQRDWRQHIHRMSGAKGKQMIKSTHKHTWYKQTRTDTHTQTRHKHAQTHTQTHRYTQMNTDRNRVHETPPPRSQYQLDLLVRLPSHSSKSDPYPLHAVRLHSHRASPPLRRLQTAFCPLPASVPWLVLTGGIGNPTPRASFPKRSASIQTRRRSDKRRENAPSVHAASTLRPTTILSPARRPVAGSAGIASHSSRTSPCFVRLVRTPHS